MEILEPEQLEAFLSDYTNWTENDEGMLVATFEFDTFLNALDFVNQVAEEAEVMQHHPDIDIRYNEVTIGVITHDVGGQITTADIELITRIEGLLL